MRKRSSCEEDRHYQDVENKKLHVLSGFWIINLNLSLLHVEEGDSILLRVSTVYIIDLKYWVAFYLND